MASNLERFRQDLDKLIKAAEKLYLTMAYDLNLLDEKTKKAGEKARTQNFKADYEKWYTEAVYVLKQILPERLDDFIKLYKNEKRKETNYTTYTMSDYLLGVTVTYGVRVTVEPKAGFPKFEIQKGILESAVGRFESTLFDIQQLLQADIFDSEIDSARELIKNGYERAAGVISGVVIEKHLAQVCSNHKITVKKKNPSISDYNDALKEANIIEIPTWRFIQHLSDIRNLCAHKKTRDPKKEEVLYDKMIYLQNLWP
jgi:galactitol-specific phosphotransferase system IIB component